MGLINRKNREAHDEDDTDVDNSKSKKKHACAICGKPIGAMDPRYKMADGYLCKSCSEGLGLHSLSSMRDCQGMTLEEIKQWHSEKTALVEKVEAFNPTSTIGEKAKFDDDSKEFIIAPEKKSSYKPTDYVIVKYDQVLDYELFEDGDSIASGGLGRAVAGAFLFGAAGAVVGGVTGRKKSREICDSLQIKLTLRNASEPTLYVVFVDGDKLKKSSSLYKDCFKQAQDCMSMFKIITDSMDDGNAGEAANTAVSAADEIKKFKELLDMGAITQDEYDAKKKELLGL